MESISDEELLAQYAYTPIRMKTGMVVPVKVPSQPKTRIWPTASGLGRLDGLPVEVLHMTFKSLDFRTLIRLTQTARRGHELVMAMPDYANALKYAGSALSALRDMRILGVHSVTSINYALRSNECVSCGGSGAFLFLMECERACWKCLSRNQSLWVMPRLEAGKCFNRSATQLKQLPFSRSIPGKYSVRFNVSRAKSLTLVSVRAAKQLALQIHGSQNALRAHMATRRSSVSENTYYTWAHLHRANPDFVKHDPCTVIDPANSTNDYYNGMAATRFPYQATVHSLIDPGVWYRGCRWTWDNQHSIPDDLQQLFPSGYERYTWVCLALRERLSEEFLTHAKRCYGVRKMVERKQEGISDIITDYI